MLQSLCSADTWSVQRKGQLYNCNSIYLDDPFDPIALFRHSSSACDRESQDPLTELHSAHALPHVSCPDRLNEMHSSILLPFMAAIDASARMSQQATHPKRPSLPVEGGHRLIGRSIENPCQRKVMRESIIIPDLHLVEVGLLSTTAFRTVD